MFYCGTMIRNELSIVREQFPLPNFTSLRLSTDDLVAHAAFPLSEIRAGGMQEVCVTCGIPTFDSWNCRKAISYIRFQDIDFLIIF